MLICFNININEYVKRRTKNPGYPRKLRKIYIYIYIHSTSQKIIQLTSYIKISISCDVIKCLGNTDLPCPYPCLDNPASRVWASFRDVFPRENHRKKIVRGAFDFPLPFLSFSFSFSLFYITLSPRQTPGPPTFIRITEIKRRINVSRADGPNVRENPILACRAARLVRVSSLFFHPSNPCTNLFLAPRLASAAPLSFFSYFLFHSALYRLFRRTVNAFEHP